VLSDFVVRPTSSVILSEAKDRNRGILRDCSDPSGRKLRGPQDDIVN
jgi:hypothetical protein